MRERFGPVPPDASPNTARNDYATAVLTDWLMPERQPDLAILWLSEPDHSQHAFDVGSPEALASISRVDACVARVLAAADRLGVAGETNVLVTSDHGFISQRPPGLGVVDALIEAGLKQDRTSPDVRVIGSGVYLAPSARDRLAAVVRCIQQQPAVGPVFTREVVEGTLALSAVGCEHARSPDVLFAPRWSDGPNAFGSPGVSAGGGGNREGNHGGASPFEIQSVLIAAGPSFKRGVVSDTPSGIIDVAPTVLATAGLAAPATLPRPDGRVLAESLIGGKGIDPIPVASDGAWPMPQSIRVDRHELSASVDLPGGRYRASAEVLTVAGVWYLRQANGGVEPA